MNKKLLAFLSVLSLSLSLPLTSSEAAPPVLSCESNLENGNLALQGALLSRVQQSRVSGIDKLWSKGTNGAGQTIAVLGGGNFLLSDIDTFKECNKLNNKLTIKSVGSQPFQSTSEKGSAEWVMDIQTAMSLAPGADIIFYKANDIFGALKAVGDDNEADIITSSFGSGAQCEELDSGGVFHNKYDALYKKLAEQGQTMLRGMGDMGTLACARKGSKPPDNLTPSIVTGAGSPWLTVLSGIRIRQIEPLQARPWNSTPQGPGGGSGISIFAPRPAWQNAPGFSSAITKRFSPDFVVQSEGTIMFLNGAWTAGSGDSMTGPFMSGVLATVAQSCSNGKSDYRLGWLNPALYAMARDNLGFADITSGKNMSFGYGGFEAKVGHDLASGLGTIDSKTFATNLCAYVSKTPRDIYFNQTEITPTFTSIPVSTPKPTANKLTTLTCIRGTLTKTVTAAKPECPPGYKKK
jgi:subtilase family serine protease